MACYLVLDDRRRAPSSACLRAEPSEAANAAHSLPLRRAPGALLRAHGRTGLPYLFEVAREAIDTAQCSRAQMLSGYTSNPVT